MLNWTQELATGVDIIDAQHRQLFERINSLLAAMGQGKGKQTVGQVLDFMSEYVVTHFGTEERLMQQSGYPAMLAHKREHTDYRAKLEQLKSRFVQQGESSLLAIESQRLLVDWWYTHIGKVDKALGEFLRDNGHDWPAA